MASRTPPPLRIICGPTGGGKTYLAVALARRLAPAESLVALSADSRQLYDGFRIGTAAPTDAELQALPHALVGTVKPTARFTAADWAGAADAVISQAVTAGRAVVVVGGTGFYLRALREPLFAEPPIDEGRRRALRAWMRARDHETIARWALALDPGASHPGRAQRERAVEMALLTGYPLHRWRRRAAPAVDTPGVPVRYLVVDPGDALVPRLADRVRAMIAAGWLDEVRALDGLVPATAPAWQACGYEVMRDVVRGIRPLDDAVARVLVETRQYAKRQRTWFRHQLRDGPVTRLDPTAPDALDRALAWWHGLDSPDARHP
jgi:tRNA dimethylallyltransferase